MSSARGSDGQSKWVPEGKKEENKCPKKIPYIGRDSNGFQKERKKKTNVPKKFPILGAIQMGSRRKERRKQMSQKNSLCWALLGAIQMGSRRKERRKQMSQKNSLCWARFKWVPEEKKEENKCPKKILYIGRDFLFLSEKRSGTKQKFGKLKVNTLR